MPLTFGRSVREPPLNGANKKRPDLSHCAALAMRNTGEFFVYAFIRWGHLYSDGIREKQRLRWVSTDSGVHELLAMSQ
jgi:hypothetical protein